VSANINIGSYLVFLDTKQMEIRDYICYTVRTDAAASHYDKRVAFNLSCLGLARNGDMHMLQATYEVRHSLRRQCICSAQSVTLYTIMFALPNLFKWYSRSRDSASRSL
jgi:hypothetical protein